MRPADRLSAAFRMEVGPTTRSRHLAEISEALRAAPIRRGTPAFGFRRRFVAAAAAMAAVFVPVGAAVAAETSLPGEFLYPVKQLTEDVRGLFDEDLAATHRVEELEALLDESAEREIVAETERRAAAEIAALDNPAELAQRLERARVRIRDQARQGPGPGPVDLPGGPADPEGSDGTISEEEQPEEPPGSGSGEQSRDRDRTGSSTSPGTAPPTSEGPGSGHAGSSGSGGAGGDGPGGSGSSGGGSSGEGSGGSGGDGSDNTGGRNGSSGSASGGASGGSGGNGARP